MSVGPLSVETAETSSKASRPRLKRPVLVATASAALLIIVIGGVLLLKPDLLHPSASPVAPAKLAELVDQNLPIAQAVDVMAMPDAKAPQIIRLHAGLVVKVVGIVTGSDWLQIELPDHQIGYVPIAAIPALKPPAADQAPPPTAAPPAAPPVAPGPTAETSAAPPADTPAAAVAPVEFDAVTERWKLNFPGKVYVAPDTHAPVRETISPGTLVDVIAKSKDGLWAWVRTADDSPAYIPLEVLVFVEAAKPAAAASQGAISQAPSSPDSAAPPPAPPALPDEVSGQARVVTTGLLTIAGHKVALAGVRGEGGTYRDQLQALINAKGGTLACMRVGQAYSCQFSDGIDLGRTVLFNGAARLGTGASEDYREQARSAEDAHRGLWQ